MSSTAADQFDRVYHNYNNILILLIRAVTVRGGSYDGGVY